MRLLFCLASYNLKRKAKAVAEEKMSQKVHEKIRHFKWLLVFSVSVMFSFAISHLLNISVSVQFYISQLESFLAFLVVLYFLSAAVRIW